MKSKFLMISIFLLFGCSIFEQNDFILTENILQIQNERFIYSVFQTGWNNYRIEFKIIVKKDTAQLFDYFINDVRFSKENTFHFCNKNDTLVVISPFQISNFYNNTQKGTIIEITNK